MVLLRELFGTLAAYLGVSIENMTPSQTHKTCINSGIKANERNKRVVLRNSTNPFKTQKAKSEHETVISK